MPYFCYFFFLISFEQLNYQWCLHKGSSTCILWIPASIVKLITQWVLFDSFYHSTQVDIAVIPILGMIQANYRICSRTVVTLSMGKSLCPLSHTTDFKKQTIKLSFSSELMLSFDCSITLDRRNTSRLTGKGIQNSAVQVPGIVTLKSRKWEGQNGGGKRNKSICFWRLCCLQGRDSEVFWAVSGRCAFDPIWDT